MTKEEIYLLDVQERIQQGIYTVVGEQQPYLTHKLGSLKTDDDVRKHNQDLKNKNDALVQLALNLRQRFEGDMLIAIENSTVLTKEQAKRLLDKAIEEAEASENYDSFYEHVLSEAFDLIGMIKYIMFGDL